MKLPMPMLVTLAWGGIAALDATPVAQSLLSQPLVSAVVLGWVWGEMPLALEVGIVLQILAASTLPIGARTPEDYAAGGVVGVGLALALADHVPFAIARDGCALIGVMAGMVGATAGVPLLKWQRRLGEGLGRWCESAVRAGRESALAESQRAAVVLAFGVGVLYCAVCLGLGFWGLRGLVVRDSLGLARTWHLAQPIWIGFGLAQLLNAFIQRRLVRAALFGAALLAAWLVLMLGPA